MSGLPDDLPPELLAGYADGELPPAIHARVEAWLRDHPEYLDLLDAQEALGPGNTEFWRAVRPPAPGAEEWVGVENELSAQVHPNKGGLGRWAGAAALFAAAASLVVAVVENPPRCGVDARLPVTCPVVPGDSDDEPFPIARADEVRYLSLPESMAPMIVVGEHPLKDPLLVLARADEVDFHGMGADAAGRFPADPLTFDPPVIWTPAQRELCPE